MKKIIYISIIFCGLIVSSSCSKDQLNLEPADQSNVETFWSSEVNAASALTGCYEPLLGPYRGEGSWLLKLEDITPNSFEIDDGSGASSIARGDNNPTLPLINSRYSITYEGIGRTNTLLANIDLVPMDEALKKRFKAEARFLRAFYYHNLIEYYGGVPLILDPPNNNTQGQLPRNTKAEVLEVIYTDLDAAAADLPISYSSTDKGRITKGAALALKARTALYNENWTEALLAAQATIDLDIYALFPDYRGLFLLENEGNSEVIFDIQFQFPEVTNNYHELFQQGNVFKDLYDAYLMTDGEPITTSTLFDPGNPNANRDPRLSQTLITIGSMFNGELVTGDELFADLTGFAFKKYTYFVDDVKRTPPQPNQSEINPIVIRYAEILLTISEAENELNGPTERAYEAINMVRNRISVDMPDVTPGLSKEEFRNVLRLERRIEFAGEGLYYKDIIRWRTAETVMNADGLDKDGNVIEKRSFNATRDYLWPLPDRDILLNSNLEQNPGY
ncbi:RagB/SusD family nutrient uptake outer membrane protein [Arenibacter sp. BSSL-BM3]|uniref:RagB/SusD family nutrient uptake outer membrane protein n=1 Tax=Arenibacter arenosicollis TaxID=2762274 RepID=A0ABR7QRX7_9FLAO|nr:RagB/SusD family nutrient uptake outer membrane protein [Arenibacter arenosicollis]MBC8769944.1 RagB/SusD family nutrient uptake outer membrane protein [Arenibacter arenosicollis]